MKELFYKPLKFNGNPENFLFWGCLHNGHRCENWEKPLWAWRGFSSVEEHDKENINRWNEKATDKTIGFLAGDTCFGKDAEKNFLNLFENLKFSELYLLPGNHYAGWHQLFNLRTGNGFHLDHKIVTFLPNYVELIINSQSIVLSHYPILSWNGQAKGSWMLFSHVHGNLEKSEIGRMYINSGAKCYELSVEKNKRPVSFLDLSNLFKERENVSFDHHGPHTKNQF